MIKYVLSSTMRKLIYARHVIHYPREDAYPLQEITWWMDVHATGNRGERARFRKEWSIIYECLRSAFACYRVNYLDMSRLKIRNYMKFQSLATSTQAWITQISLIAFPTLPLRIDGYKRQNECRSGLDLTIRTFERTFEEVSAFSRLWITGHLRNGILYQPRETIGASP